jgi:hypothetical protein
MAEPEIDADTSVVDAELVAETPSRAMPPQEPAPRRGFAAVIGGAIAALFGFGLAQVVPNGWPLQDTAGLQASLAAQQADIDGLKAALAAVEGRPVPDATLAGRVAALEDAPVAEPVPAPPAYDDSGLQARVDGLEQQLADIAAMPRDGGGASPAALAAQANALAALQQQVAGLQGGGGSVADIEAATTAAEARLAEAEALASDMKAAAEASAAQALTRASWQQVSVALETGGPFTTALAAFDPAAVPPILADNASVGLPTISDLQTSFPDAARLALDAALRADMGDGWTDRMANFFRTQTGARSVTPRAGDDPDAILSRAEAALGEGQVADGLAEIATLPDVAKAAMQAWVDQANMLLAGQEALVALGKTVGGGE